MDLTREDILFRSEGAACRAWLYRSAAAWASAPIIVMAHGLGGLRSAGLEPYAQRFAAASSCARSSGQDSTFITMRAPS